MFGWGSFLGVVATTLIGIGKYLEMELTELNFAGISTLQGWKL